MLILVMWLAAAVQAGAGTEQPDAGRAAVAQAAPGLVAMPEVEILPYAVPGRTARAIRENMNRLRPAEPSGGRYDALTQWRFSTRWRATGRRCDPATSEVKVTIQVTLPYLSEAGRLGRRDRELWERYYAALVAHETNHARIALAGAQQMQAAMRGAPDCEALASVSQAAAEAVSAASQAYDAQTGHGRREGAVFP